MATNQLWLFLIYMASGIAICAFFDIFRSLRKSIKTSNIITYIEDVIFFIIVGYFLILEILKLNFGELRLYIFIGLALGGIIYLLTVSKYLIKINVKILTFFKNILLTVIRFIINIFKKPILFICINIKKIIRISRTNFNKKRHIKLLKNEVKKNKNVKCKEKRIKKNKLKKQKVKK